MILILGIKITQESKHEILSSTITFDSSDSSYILDCQFDFDFETDQEETGATQLPA